MNNKGFTVVELVAAFSITMIISVFLFELLIEVKDIFVETSLKTNIEEKTAIISKNINSLFLKEGNEIKSCGESTCTINDETIIINQNDISIGGQIFSTPKDGNNNAKITNSNIINNTLESGGYINISFSLTSPNLSKPYDYNVVFYYN